MSSRKTTNINLHKWDGKDNIKLDEFNDNFEIVDQEINQRLKIVVGKVPPTTNKKNTIWIDTTK